MLNKLRMAFFLVTVVLLCCVLSACDNADSGRVGVGVAKGQAAPDFTLSDSSGKSVTLSDLRGKVVLVNFWATWCPPCRQEMPSMEELYRKVKGSGVELLAINVEENGKQAVEAFIEHNPHSFPILLDPEGRAQQLYNVNKFPETFVVDKNGIVAEHVIGAINWMQPNIVEYLLSL